MSRAVLVQNMGDPYILAACLAGLKFCKNEVDKVYVLVHTKADLRVAEYCKYLVKQAGFVCHLEAGRFLPNHGPCIDYLLERCNEDYVVLVEEDGWILRPGALDEQFKLLENGTYDVIGSTRACTTEELVRTTVRRFNLTGTSPEHQVTSCPNLWPNFVFAKRDHLLKTDRDFGAKAFYPSEYIEELDFTPQIRIDADTFVWTSIQLRAQGLKFGYVHQYHCGPVDRQDYYRRSGLFAEPNLPWVHFGSLSSSMSGHVKTPDNISIGSGEYGEYYPQFDAHTAEEVSRRMVAYELCLEKYPILAPGPVDFNDTYKFALQHTNQKCNMPLSFIQDLKIVYKDLLNKIL